MRRAGWVACVAALAVGCGIGPGKAADAPPDTGVSSPRPDSGAAWIVRLRDVTRVTGPFAAPTGDLVWIENRVDATCDLVVATAAGLERFRARLGPIVSGPALAGDLVVTAEEGILVARAVADGAVRWERAVARDLPSAPATGAPCSRRRRTRARRASPTSGWPLTDRHCS